MIRDPLRGRWLFAPLSLAPLGVLFASQRDTAHSFALLTRVCLPDSTLLDRVRVPGLGWPIQPTKQASAPINLGVLVYGITELMLAGWPTIKTRSHQTSCRHTVGAPPGA